MRGIVDACGCRVAIPSLLLWVGVHATLTVWHESNVDEATVVEDTLVSAALWNLLGVSGCVWL